MPINYQPPSPVSPYTSAAYGAAQEYDKVAPTIAGMSGQSLQAGIAGAQAYNQGVGNVTARSIAAGQQSTQLEALHQSELFQAVQQQNAMAQHAQMQYAAQEQQAAQQRAQQDQEQRMLQQHYALQFGQAQELQRQKYEQADAWIQQKLAAKEITPDEALNWSATVRGHQSPLEMQKMRSEAAYKQSQAKEAQEVADFRHQQALKAAKIEAMTIDERTKHVLGPNGEVIGTFVLDTKGEYHEVKHDTAKQDHIAQLEQHETAHYLDAWKKAQDHVDKQIADAIKEDKTGGVREWWSKPGRRQEFLRNTLAEAGLPPTLGQYQARNRATRGQTSALAPAGTPQGQPPAPPPQSVERPFTPGDEAGMSDNQKAFVGNLSGILQQAQKNPDYSDGTKEKVTEAAHLLHGTLGKYGSFDRVPPAETAKVRSALETIDNRDVLDQTPFTPGKPQEMTRQQTKVVGELSKQLSMMELRQDLPKPQQEKSVEAIHGLHGLLAKYGWMKNPATGEPNPKITDADKKKAEEYAAFLKTVPPTPSAGGIPKSGYERHPGLQFRPTGY